MKKFYDTLACYGLAHCPTCRWQSDEGHKWRESIAEHFSVPEIDFDCPEGKPWEKELKRLSRGLGDTIAKAIKYVSGGRIKPCGGCNKRRVKLNKLVPYA